MDTFLKNSFFYHLIQGLFQWLKAKWSTGVVGSFFKKLASKVEKLNEGSAILDYLDHSDPIDLKWEQSKINQILSWIFNLPIRLFRALGDRIGPAMDESAIINRVTILSQHLVHVLGVGLFIILVIPDHRWHNAYSLMFMVGLFLLYLLLSYRNRTYDLSLTALDSPVVILFIIFGLSAVFSLYPHASKTTAILYFNTFLILLLSANYLRKTIDIEIFVHYLIMGLIFTALYGIYQWKVVGIEINPSFTDVTVNRGLSGRVFSTMGNPNVYGEALVLLMPLILSTILNTKQNLLKLFYAGGFLLSLVILLKTGSRSAWIAFAVAMGTFIYFKDKRWIPVFIVLGILLIPFLPASIYNRILSTFNSNDSSLKYRKLILQPTLPMLRSYGLTGIGLGTDAFKIVFERFKTFNLKTVSHTHHLFLQLWLESGIMALLTFLWMGFRLVKKVRYMRKFYPDRHLTNLSVGALAGIAGVVIMGFADYIFFYHRVFLIFWLNVAIILCSYQILNKILVIEKS